MTATQTEVLEPTELDTPMPTLAELSRTVAFADAFEKHIKASVAGTRAAVTQALNAIRRETGVKQVDVLLDSDDAASKVATITLKDNPESIVVSNDDEYTAWVEANYPDEVEYVVRVRDSFRKVHLESLTNDGGLVIDPAKHQVDEASGAVIADGIVEGTRVKPAGDPTSITLTFARAGKKDPDGGRVRTLAHMASLPLQDIVAAASVPAIEA